MMHSCVERMMIIWSLCLIFCISNSVLVIAKDLCLPDQRDALLEFKNEFYIPSQDSGFMIIIGKTEKWRNNTDCCSWDGVSCDPKTGVVVELNLEYSNLNGPLRSNSSLFRLQHLQRLALANNYLSGILPDSIGNLKYLRSLSFRRCYLFGKIPSSLGSLSYLTFLSLSENDFTSDSMGNLNRLTDFQLMLLNLSSLTGINLGYNQFRGMLPSNMSSLSKLEAFDISGNSFSGTIPSSLFMIPSLTYLDLGTNDFSGPFEIGNISSLSNLQQLYIGENNFNGPIPGSISKLVGLSALSLSFWDVGGGIVDFSIFLHLKSLRSLNLAYLNTRSMVDLSCFSHLMLLELDLSGNDLKISSTLHFPSPMYTLILSSCNISEFPKFLQNQTSLEYLDISANQIEGQVPDWLWSLPKLRKVNISQNSFSGELTMLPNSIYSFIGSDNQFSGEIPKTICELEILFLSNNNFSGSLPRCVENKFSRSILHLRNNSLSGLIPEEILSGNLMSLDVGHNQLSGQLPKSLMNCTYLQFLNVEDNRINDTFPFWLRSLPYLQILVLRSNEFHGPISSPGDSLSFPELRIFDISENSFSGGLPSDYFVGWSAMSSVVAIDYRLIFSASAGLRESYHNSVVLTNKGSKVELVGSGFTIYKTIDVSGNRLEGDIPKSIGILKELIVLNMSNNAFTGHIPLSLSNLSNLESLDLSQNRLSGSIPPELGKLTFLEWMNFSYNRLEGPIPQATQIQSQNSSSFAENPGLCDLMKHKHQLLRIVTAPLIEGVPPSSQAWFCLASGAAMKQF
ncbi:receptor like protein 30-like [Arabidopsis lyrata subsp. lyrata]|uniref:receptor like protein 30-like n=1 Tax=Arabidopsis lyrata subsp. lyrata TaxID=81972 RepID=UPI000A29AE3C|nr:receptor like protein 30-like [Arabidopsis lyrata subsp. lyrata]|eukprot:XP_020874091.1 receptor like protein 30-like [Arabidopsis lyrata subsp. lyrata]